MQTLGCGSYLNKMRAHSQANASTAARRPPPTVSCSPRPGSLAPLVQPPSSRAAAIVPQAKRGSSNGPKSSSKSFSFEKENGVYRVNLNERELMVPESALVVAFLAMFGIGAVIGPLIIGLVITAISIGVTLSVGAFALSTMFLPMAIFSIFFFLTFGGAFGGMALLGASVFAPKLLSLIVTGAGLAIGWAAVQMFLPKKRSESVTVEFDRAGHSGLIGREGASSSAGKKKGGAWEEPVIDVALEAEEAAAAEAERLSRELRDFDQMLADREHRKRVDQWRNDKLGR